jgi:assimilatory nitrate reductase electron transfer subunit
MTPTRIVVVGHGMVGARFVEELHARDGASRFDVTVLAQEEHEPYNRVLLSDFVGGRTTAAGLAMPRTGTAADVHRGATALHVDRRARTVRTADALHPYDVLVLATGAQARVLPLDGADPQDPPPGLHTLRTLDDARGIVAASMNARRALVLGGGVLGIEAAVGLARRGPAVTLVHAAASLMERQLGPDAATVAARVLASAGVAVELGAVSTGVELRQGRLAGLRLADGRTLPADLLVLACGTQPATALAVDAGLPVGRGILVGADLASPADPRIFAIGDCAEPPGGATGLVAQGWGQARQLAAALAGAAGPEPDACPTDVVRVKGDGLDIVAMGSRPPAGARTITLSDPDGGRHVEVVVAQDRLVAATCIGGGQVAADLVARYTRSTPLPADPARLLLRPLAGTGAPQASSPTTMPDRATVCRCNGVTKKDIRTCFANGARTLPEVAASTRATTGCGGCTETVTGLLEWLTSADPLPAESASQPAAASRAADVRQMKHSAHGLETSAR